MRRVNKIGEEKGFTLVELIVSLLIVAMLMSTIGMVLLASQKLYIRGENISYKQKSITNVETDLQNSLAKAIRVEISNNADAGADYNIGFNDEGECVEIFKGSDKEYIVDQIFEITLKTVQTNPGALDTQLRQKTLNYELIPKKSMSTLSGGIIMNNSENGSFYLSTELYVGQPKIELQNEKPRYLVIYYATETS